MIQNFSLKKILLLFILFGFVLFSPLISQSKEDPKVLELFEMMQNRIIQIAEEQKQAVVHIEAILKVDNSSIATTGSGIIVDEMGHILTNEHVVRKAEKVTVKLLGEKKIYLAEIIGTDEQTDLAVLKIKPSKKLKAPRFGDSSQLRVGDWVVAIGNPYGLDGTVSFGIISAVQRNLNIGGLLNEFIQTDAMIDFGSSGGPLINIRGEIIGINSRGQGRGIGFTIPINTALEIRNKLIQEGQVERAWLGVTIQPFDRDMAEYFGIPKVTGVIINQVHDNSSAENAGLKAGDILTHFDGKSIEAEEENELRGVSRTIAKTPVGKKVKIIALRNGKKLHLQTKMLLQPKLEGDELHSKLGFNVQEITNILFIERRLRTKKGVYVSFVEPGSIADEARLFKGDIIQKVVKKDTPNLKSFSKNAKNLEKQKRILLHVKRGNDLKLILLKNDRRSKSEKF